MNSTRRTRTHVVYTTRRGRSFCLSKETEEIPDYRTPPTLAVSPYNYAQAYVYVPPVVHSQGTYSGYYSRYQSPVIPHQSTPSTAYSQQHTNSHSTYHSLPSTYQGEPQNQLRGTSQGSNHDPPRSIASNPGVVTQDVQSWVNGTVQSNAPSRSSRRTNSQYAGSASGHIDQHEDRNQRRDKERSRRGSVYAPSHRSGTDYGSQAGGRAARSDSQQGYVRKNRASKESRYPVATFVVNGQLQAFYASP